jgi:hypothetical protein
MALTEEQLKTIRVARAAYKIMMEEQLGPALKDFVKMVEMQREIYKGAPWMPKPQPASGVAPKPEVDPAEQKALQEVLAEASKEKK